MTTSRTGVLRVAIVASIVAIAGCGGPTDPSAVTVFATAASYPVDGYARFVVRNGARETIRVDRCGQRVQAGLSRRSDAGWETEVAAVCILAMYSPPLELAPGESVTDSVLVRNAGTYRVFVGYGRGNLDILYMATSGGFTVE